MNKYGNKKITLKIDGVSIKFDSKAEAGRAVDLIGLRDSLLITNLDFQPEFILQERFKCNGRVHRAIKYIADFSYETDDGRVIEDVKGVKTPEYQIKKKLFLHKYGSELVFKEVYLKKGLFVINEF